MADLATPSELRKQAKRYLSAARKLQQAADILDGQTTSMAGNKNRLKTSSGSRRLDELRAYLERYGPQKRSRIVRETGIPTGTVGSLLSREGFWKDSQARWHLPEDETDLSLEESDSPDDSED